MRSVFFYNFLSFLYEKLIIWSGYKSAITHYIQRVSLPDKNIKILDAGCGTGLIAFILAEKYHNAEIIGFDYSSKMIQQAEIIKSQKRENNVTFYVGDMEKISPMCDEKGHKKELGINSFDYIFVSGALEYTDFQKSVGQFHNLLRPRGALYNIAVKNNWKGKLLGKIMGFTPYPKDAMIHLLQKTGFYEVTEIPFQGKEERRAANFKRVLKAIKK